MQLRDITVIARTVGMRTCQIFIFGPATVIALVAVLVMARGASPIESYLKGVYGWAESSVRPVSVGQVLIHECRGGAEKRLGCEQPSTRVVDAESWISTTSSLWREIYLLIAAATALALMVTLGWRRFAGLNHVARRS